MTVFKKIIDSFDSSEELAQVQREAVEALARVAQEKADIFDYQIKEKLRTAGREDNLTIPVGAILASTKQTHAYTSKSADTIKEVVETSLRSFAAGTKGDIIDGVANLVSGAITVFLGEASAATGTLEQYYVMTEGLSIVRVDLNAWYINVTAKSIYDKMERATAFCAVKSSVNLGQIDFNTFLYLYQEELRRGGLKDKQLSEALQEARDIYKNFKEVSGSALATSRVFPVIATPPASLHLAQQP